LNFRAELSNKAADSYINTMSTFGQCHEGWIFLNKYWKNVYQQPGQAAEEGTLPNLMSQVVRPVCIPTSKAPANQNLITNTALFRLVQDLLRAIAQKEKHTNRTQDALDSLGIAHLLAAFMEMQGMDHLSDKPQIAMPVWMSSSNPAHVELHLMAIAKCLHVKYTLVTANNKLLRWTVLSTYMASIFKNSSTLLQTEGLPDTCSKKHMCEYPNVCTNTTGYSFKNEYWKA
jgi:hypothetical protein